VLESAAIRPAESLATPILSYNDAQWPSAFGHRHKLKIRRMRFYRHRRETLEGAFSLLNTELRVGEISDTKGNQFKGISLYGGLHGHLVGADRAIVLDDLHAKHLVDFLDRIRQKQLPTEFSVAMNRFETLSWNVSKFLPDWHDGGGLGGGIGIKTLLGMSMIPATITIDAAKALRACLADFYGVH
jgi:hypothetical protein